MSLTRTPAILPSELGGHGLSRLRPEHLAVLPPGVLLASGAEPVPFGCMAEQIVNGTELVVHAQAGCGVHLSKEGMRIAALVEIEVAIDPDVSAHDGGSGGIRLALVPPRIEGDSHHVYGKPPLLLDLCGKLAIGSSDACVL